jgi:DNA-binding MarR family transcriptional regulator
MNNPMLGAQTESIQVELMQALHRTGRLAHKLPFMPLSRGEFFILCLLASMSREQEVVYVSHLAHRMEVSQPAISRLLRGLEQKGYISRETGTKDRRNTVVQMTKAGYETLSQAKTSLFLFGDDLVTALTAEKTTQLVALLNELNCLMEERVGDGV